MEQQSLKKQTAHGLLWSGIERFAVQGVQLLVTIVLARIISPADFGLVGMLAIFLAVSQSIVDSGFSNALIRKLDRTETDFSTAFYFNIVVGIVLYFILFFCAPLIARFYDQPILTPLTKVVALNIFINSLTIVQRAKLTIKVDFKTQAKASFTGVIVSGTVGIVMAYNGYGVWSLAVQTVLNGFVNMVALWWMAHWMPRKVFSWESFRGMFSYGSKLMASGLIDTIYQNVYQIVIGKVYSPATLGYYTQASRLSQFPSANLTGILGRVTFPILSTLQNDDDRLRHVYRQYLRLSAFVVFPLMLGLAVLAHPVIGSLLGEKWLPAAPLLQLLCLAGMWYPIHAINLNLLQVKGRSDLFLRLEIIKKAVGVAILCITIPMGVTAMCAGSVVTSVIGLIINTYYTGVLLQFGFWKQMKDLLPILLQTAVMSLVVYFSVKWIGSGWIQIILGVTVGIATYWLYSLATGSKEYQTLIGIIAKKL